VWGHVLETEGTWEPGVRLVYWLNSLREFLRGEDSAWDSVFLERFGRNSKQEKQTLVLKQRIIADR
jgi:hypothetical protein